MKRALVVALVCFALALSGCGYSFGTFPAQDRDGPWRVFVPVFSNQTMESGFEAVMTNALRRELSLRSGFELAGRDEADLIIRGDVVAAVVSPAAFSEDFFALKYRIEVVARIEAVVVDTGEIVWRADALRGTGQYYAHTDVIITDGNKREALHRIARDLSQSICEMMWF